MRNKEKVKAYNQKYYLSHTEKIKEKAKSWYHENKEKAQKVQKEYRKSNPQKIKERRKLFYFKNTNPTIRGRYKKIWKKQPSKQ